MSHTCVGGRGSEKSAIKVSPIISLCYNLGLPINGFAIHMQLYFEPYPDHVNILGRSALLIQYWILLNFFVNFRIILDLNGIQYFPKSCPRFAQTSAPRTPSTTTTRRRRGRHVATSVTTSRRRSTPTPWRPRFWVTMTQTLTIWFHTQTICIAGKISFIFQQIRLGVHFKCL